MASKWPIAFKKGSVPGKKRKSETTPLCEKKTKYEENRINITLIRSSKLGGSGLNMMKVGAQ